MISMNLNKAFKDLDTNNKKNIISDELLFIGQLIKKLNIYHDLEDNFEIKNYSLKSNLSEEEYLEFIYNDIFEIQKQLLLMLTNIQNK